MIEVISTGGMTTVQDLGRRGFRRIGVGLAGPLDFVAAQVGNTMVGNRADAAFLEVLLFPVRLRFLVATRVAVTGTDTRTLVDDRLMPPWWSVPVEAGQVLTLQAPSNGGVAYLCIAGGLDVPIVMGSRSTDLKASFGGFRGRPLKKGDRLGLLAATEMQHRKRFGVLPPSMMLESESDTTVVPPVTSVRVLPSTQWDSFSPEMQACFTSTAWRISPKSNRIGLRLEGPTLRPNRDIELLSHGIVPGAVQVPPGGQPIVMQCDAQTSGGYPRIATVIEADQWRLAQAAAGSQVLFRPVQAEEALAALVELNTYVNKTRTALDIGL